MQCIKGNDTKEPSYLKNPFLSPPRKPQLNELNDLEFQFIHQPGFYGLSVPEETFQGLQSLLNSLAKGLLYPILIFLRLVKHILNL